MTMPLINATTANIAIGVMSGTSLDGVDIVAVSFNPLQLHATQSIDFPDTLRDDLLALTTAGDNEIERMGLADVAFGRLIGTSVRDFLIQNKINNEQILVIGSHGQTIRHRPEHGFSLQIGDPNLIAELTNLPVVADFRRRDMAAGGQGAPLVPAFHQAIFQHPTIHRVILNLGGMANISVLPATELSEQHVYGFDTGPANVLMDAWCALHTGKPYDAAGQWAATGIVHQVLFDCLFSHAYFKKTYPKSTGREDFNIDWLQAILQASPVFQKLSAADVQATLLELTAKSVVQAVLSSISDLKENQTYELWLCGGGAYNKTLWQRLSVLLPDWTLHSTSEYGLAPTWVEATAFAWLACQRIQHQSANLPAVTGASGLRVLGGVW